MKQKILSQITTECPWRDTLYWYDAIDSTNTQAKNMAKQGAPHGTVVIAGSQSAGRGRMGRSFTSPPDAGLYLSVVLRPNCPAEALMHLTCAAAVAGCDAVEAVCGIRPDIKWTNDLVFGSKKLGGILTELSINSATGLVDFAIIGIAGLISMVLLVQNGFMLPAALTLGYGFLTIRLDDATIVDFIHYAVRYFLTTQQYYEWR